MLKRIHIVIIVISVPIAAFIVGVLALVCWDVVNTHDSFAGTKAVFSLDKDSYMVGDTVTLTLELSGTYPVRVCENFEHTLSVWLGFRVPYRDEHTALTYEGIMTDDICSRPGGVITTHDLEKEGPLLFKFKGTLSSTEHETAFVLEFPDLNKRFIIDKVAYSAALALEIHGQLHPISPRPLDSLEDYVSAIRFVISQ